MSYAKRSITRLDGDNKRGKMTVKVAFPFKSFEYWLLPQRRLIQRIFAPFHRSAQFSRVLFVLEAHGLTSFEHREIESIFTRASSAVATLNAIRCQSIIKAPASGNGDVKQYRCSSTMYDTGAVRIQADNEFSGNYVICVSQASLYRFKFAGRSASLSLTIMQTHPR